VPFLQNEDEALKLKFQGLTVTDAAADPTTGRRVDVRFKNPEYEFSDATYPLVLLSHTSIARDPERESRGDVTIGYAPEGYPKWSDMLDPSLSPYRAETPIPLNVNYGIQVFARKQQHLIQLTGQLMGFNRLPPRLGFLPIPQDGTIRRLDILGGPEYMESKDERGKRLFVAMYEILISSEIFLSDIYSLPPALKVLFDYVWLPTDQPIS
jgi:hypothetical protein